MKTSGDSQMINTDANIAKTLLIENTYFDDLLALQAELKNPIKTEAGYANRYTYAKLPDMLDEIKPVLTKHNFFMSQLCDGDYLITELIHRAGDKLKSRIVLSDERIDAQKYGSWMTYMRRYAILAMFSLAGEDDDGQATVTNTFDKPNVSENRAVVAKMAVEESDLDKMPKTVNDVTYEWREGVYQGYPYAGWYPPKHLKQSKDNPDGLQKHDTDADMAQYIKDHGSNEDQAQLSDI